MVDATLFFESPAMDMCSIFSQVFGIVVDHIKTFATLALLQSIAIIPVLLVFGLVVYESFSSSVAALGQTMNTGDGGNLYEQNAYGDQNTFDTNEDIPFSAILNLLGLFVAYIVASICISALFQGAFVRAASEVFAGHTPNWRACLGNGWKKMCPIICFSILCVIAVSGTSIIWAFATFYPQGDNFSFGLSFLSILIFFTVLFVFAVSMTAGLSAIVVENKSPFAAFERSWDLCKSKTCFIFCCVFCFYAMEIICQLAINSVLKAIATSITSGDSNISLIVNMVSSWLMGLFLGPVNATINPIIYFSLRIQKEGLTMEELRGDLSLLDDSIELQTGVVECGIPAMEDPSLFPITKATAV